MCRSIKTLRGEPRITEDDIEAAARQYVRKLSGYREPSKANREVFQNAIEDISAATQRLLEGLTTSGHRAK